VEEARALLAQSGLELPPIPPSLEARFSKRAEWCFASRSVRRSPYCFPEYVEQAIVRPPKDYVLVAHAGHGVNSYALHYFLLLRPLMLFVQVPWGGVYEDRAVATADANACFGLCHSILEATERAVRTGQLERDRLVVVASAGLHYPTLFGFRDDMRRTGAAVPDNTGLEPQVPFLKRALVWCQGGFMEPIPPRSIAPG
jgi:hypothetical protein